MSEENTIELTVKYDRVNDECSCEKINLNNLKDREKLLELARKSEEDGGLVIANEDHYKWNIEPITKVFLYFSTLEGGEKYIEDLGGAILEWDAGGDFLEEVNDEFKKITKDININIIKNNPEEILEQLRLNKEKDRNDEIDTTGYTSDEREIDNNNNNDMDTIDNDSEETPKISIKIPKIPKKLMQTKKDLIQKEERSNEKEEEDIEEALEREATKIKVLLDREEEKPIEIKTVRVKGFNKIKKRKKSEKEQLANLIKQERELTNEEKVEIVNTLNSRGNIVDTYEYCITPFLEGIENINNNPIKDLFKNVENHEKINVRTKKEELKEFIGKIPKENLARLNCMLSIEGIKERLNEISENRDSEIKLGDFISDSVNSEVVARTKTSGYSCNIC